MAHHAGPCREMALDDFLRELDSARSEGADDGDAPHSGFEVVEVGAVGQVLIRPKAEVSSIPQACSLVAEVLPPTPEPRINIRDTFFDPLAILQVCELHQYHDEPHSPGSFHGS
eukprot:SAG11_NODE_166_length_13763_cov_8.292722_3_plen_114_part_00